MAARRHYFAPSARGTGDGSSRANAEAWSRSRVPAVMAAWQAQDKANPSLKSQDDPCSWGHRVLTGGTLNGKPISATNPEVGGTTYRGKKVMKYDQAVASIAGRILVCDGLGDYSVPENDTEVVLTPTQSGPGGSGTAADPIRFYIIESDNGAGEPIEDSPSSTTTVTTPVSAKGGTATDWNNTANYDATTGNWKGSVVSKNHTFTVERPRTGATFVGKRTTDIRPNRTDYQWIVDGGRRAPSDPTSTSANPMYRQSDAIGTPFLTQKGDVFHMPTKTFTTPRPKEVGGRGVSFGNNWMHIKGANYIIIRGLEFKNFMAMCLLTEVKDLATRDSVTPSNFIQWRDIATDNSTYFNIRGNACSDWWFYRIQVVAWSEKAITQGHKCHRWLAQQVWMDGAFVVGDYYKCGFSAVAPHDAGPMVIENFYGYCFWDAVDADSETNAAGEITSWKSEYFQGECLDFEAYNIQMSNFKIDLCGDGGADTKARTRWVGYYPVVFINGVFSRAKRAVRLWGPAGDMGDGARDRFNCSLLMDVVLQDIRQHGLYMPTGAPHHRCAEWDNGGFGWANFDRRVFPTTHAWNAVTHEGDIPTVKTKGNLTALIWQPLDTRPAGTAIKATNNGVVNLAPGPSKHKINADGTQGDVILGVDVNDVPFRRKVITPATPRPTIEMLVDGQPHNPDFPVVMPSSGVITLTPPGTGTKVWTNKSSTGTLVVAANKNTATYTRKAT